LSLWLEKSSGLDARAAERLRRDRLRPAGARDVEDAEDAELDAGGAARSRRRRPTLSAVDAQAMPITHRRASRS